MPPERLPVSKTYKLYVDGRFPRSESGRTLALTPSGGAPVAHVCRASRKDLRDAVTAARRAQPAWAGLTPYLRGQILYRLAEMLETRRDSFVGELRALGAGAPAAGREVDAACDRLVYFAGWSDKFAAVAGSVNPVSGPYFNFTVPEPMGVVVMFAPEEAPLLGLCSLIAAAVVGGNTVVALASGANPLPGISLGEVCAVSDVPAGVINLLSGRPEELAPVAASHGDVNAIVDATGDPERRALIEREGAVNLKRTAFPAPGGRGWRDPEREGLEAVLRTVEMKTTWHPVGL